MQEGVPTAAAMPCQCGDDCACGGTCGGNCGIEGCKCKPLAPAPPAACACGPDCAACSVSPGGPLGVGLTGTNRPPDLTAAGTQGTCGDNCAWCSAGCKDGCCK